MYTELESYGANIDLHDPLANPSQVWEEYGIKLKFKTDTDYDAIILLVAHHQFHSLKLKKLVKHSHIIYDVKGMLPKEQVDFRL